MVGAARFIMLTHLYNMSRVVRKLAFSICENKDADQLRGNRNFQPLAIFCGCIAWFVWDLVGNPEDRFSHNEAHIECNSYRFCMGGAARFIMLTHLYNMSRVVRKLAFSICENKDADQLRGNRNFQPLAIFCGCIAWFVWDLVGNPEDRFSHNEAHIECNSYRFCMGGAARFITLTHLYNMSRVVRKLAFSICENKDADQLRGNREADQRLCFRYMDSAIPLLSKSEISSL